MSVRWRNVLTLAMHRSTRVFLVLFFVGLWGAGLLLAIRLRMAMAP